MEMWVKKSNCTLANIYVAKWMSSWTLQLSHTVSMNVLHIKHIILYICLFALICYCQSNIALLIIPRFVCVTIMLQSNSNIQQIKANS